MSLLEHGGKLRQAASRYGIALDQWLDLSTGINPEAYPAPPLTSADWQRLPEPDDGLLETAHGYYGTSALLPVAGSQAAIQALPRLRRPGRVGILGPTYSEHAAAWAAGGHELVVLDLQSVEQALDMLDVLVAVNPNNPTAAVLDPERLLAWHDRLRARGAWLVVDEAFVDATPELSLAVRCPAPGLIVLRSLGKFFGLAGARVGFVLAETQILEPLEALLGPWTVSGPSRAAARAALGDRAWQAKTREQLLSQSTRLVGLLNANGLAPQAHTALFAYVPTPLPKLLPEVLARQGILVRQFEQPPALRFGLPGAEPEWQRLQAALSACRRVLEATRAQ